MYGGFVTNAFLRLFETCIHLTKVEFCLKKNGKRQTGETLRLGSSSKSSIFYGRKRALMLLGTLWLCNVCKTVTGDAAAAVTHCGKIQIFVQKFEFHGISCIIEFEF